MVVDPQKAGMKMENLTFAVPVWLGLLPAALLAGILLRRRHRKIWLFQTLMLLLLILAASQPFWRYETMQKKHVVLLEEGANPGALPPEYASRDIRKFSGSPALALLETGSSLPDGGGSIVLFGSLLETDHSLEAAVEVLKQRRIAVRAVSAASPSIDRPVLRELTYPASAGTGASVELRLALESADSRTVELSIADDAGQVMSRKQPELKPGSQTVVMKLGLPRAGLFRGRVCLDGVPEAELAIDVREAFRALLISENPEREKAVFQKVFQEAVTVEIFRPGSDFSQYPLLILGEGTAGNLSREQQKQIVRCVQDGAGLLAVTGRKALFAESAVEEDYARLFPVSYEGEQEKKIPTVSLVVIIDTSGSMRGPRIDLARETARLALENLKENDLAGIVEFHGARRWAAPLQSAANQFSLMRALNRLNAGGGTVILPALQEAYYALRNTNTRLKHVLILTDGGVEYGDFESLIRKMVRSDITVSTVMVGPGESDFLSRLAMWGNGRFFRASSRFALPDLHFHPQGVEPLPPYREGRFLLKSGTNEVTSELPSDSILGGVVKSTPGKETEILLETENLPVLAVLRRGLGKTAVLNTEWNGAWTEKLMEIPEYPAMLTALARSLPDRVRFSGIAAWNRSVNRNLDFEFEVAEARPELQITLTAENGETRSWRTEAAKNGTFRFRLPDLPEGIYRMKVKDFTGNFYFVSRKAPAVSPVSSGWKAEKINRTAIPESHAPVRGRFPLAPWLGALGLLLFLVQLGMRRYAGKAVLLCLLLGCAGTADAAEYDALLRKGVLQEEAGNFSGAAQTYRRAALAAENEEDRNFSEILSWESARRAGKLSECLAESLRAGDKRSEMQTSLVIHELEERGENHRAWQLASSRQGNPFLNAEQILRLAERAGQDDWVRRQSEKMLSDPSTRILGFYLSVRLALLKGERAQAEELYRRQIEKTADPEGLSELARTAENQALYGIAEAALLKASGTAGKRYWPALFQLAGMDRSTGEISKAVDRLTAWTQEENVPSGVLLTAGDLCEQSGNPEAAVQLYAKANIEEVQMRMAMLEELRGNVDAAAALWKKIVLESPTEMRAGQSAERLVELYKKTSRLKEFCRSLAPEADAAGAPKRVAALYVRALAAAKDTETLFAFLEKHGMKESALNYHLELRQYPEAVRVLRRELAEHPDRKDKILQQLALVAVEMRDKALATESLTGLLQSGQPARDSRYEFAGAIYALTGDHRNAAACYERALQISPEKSELLLLWGKARQALGEGGKALDFFLSGLSGETSPERFGVLVDGLLNLNAPRGMLETALREVMKRVDSTPENLFYYQLAEDLTEELGETALGRRLERFQMAVAPERRTLLLQKLFLEARRLHADEEALYYGRILMARSEQYNPEFYRELCELLVENKCFIAAERCMRNADQAESGNENLSALAGTLSRHFLFADAERVYRELLILTPNHIELLEKYATMLEFQGRYEAAAEVSLKALKLLCAPQSAKEKSTGRGTKQAEFSRHFQRLMQSFANQSVFIPEKFTAQIESLKNNAPNQAQKAAWQSVLDRMALLGGNLVRTEKTKKISSAAASPQKRNELPSARELAEKLGKTASREAAAELKKIFSRLPAARKERYWVQLLDSLDFEPGNELAACLLEELNGIQLSGTVTNAEWDLPFAAGLKKEYAERALSKSPDSPQCMALAARMRHLAGNGFSARMLAEMLYEEMEKQKEFNTPDIHLLLHLNRIYAAAPGENTESGREALAERIAGLEEKRRTAGDSMQRSLLLGILYQGAENYDQAEQSLGRAWNFNRNAFVIFSALGNCVQKSGHWAGWAKLLQQKMPSDQTAQILYCMRLVPWLRMTGNRQEAQKLMSGLNPFLQQRERLLLARASGDPKQLAAEFMTFLRGVRENRGSYVLYEQNPYTGGIRGWNERNRTFSRSLFSEFAGQVPECRPYLEYLLHGTPPDTPSFRFLWNALKAMPESGRPSEGAGTTLASLILRADSAPETLSAEEKKKLLDLAEQTSLPAEISAAILKLLPQKERETAAEALVEKLLPDGGRQPDDAELYPLLELLPPEVLRKTCGRLKSMPYRGSRDTVEFQRLRLLKHFAPELCEARLRETAYPSASMLRMLTPAGTGIASCRNFLLSATEYPDWRNFVELSGNTPTLRELTQNFAAALEELGRTHWLSRDQMVRHYALLAVYDPERRKQWLEAAFRHHRNTGEASLWLLDALEFNGETEKFLDLKRKLEEEQRFPEHRDTAGRMNGTEPSL